jgi:hypothetical protein
MFTYVGIALGCLCLIAIAILGYFLYNRVKVQQSTIEQLIARQISLEGILTRPPPRQELSSFVGSRALNDDCDDCDIVPIKIQDEEVYPQDDLLGYRENREDREDTREYVDRGYRQAPYEDAGENGRADAGIREDDAIDVNIELEEASRQDSVDRDV